jgi:DNA polymerase III gamma/tau subunit
MNSFILISQDLSKQQNYLNQFVHDHAISPFDITTLAEEGSIGIEIVRKMQETIFLKPFKSKEKLIVIQSAQNLTDAAQNALLKLLEEPPLFTFIFLCSSTEEVFLPTVLSRCSVITLEDDAQAQSIDEEMLIINLSTLQNGSISEKLALAESLAADKEKLPGWIHDMTLFVREKLLQKQENQYIAILKTLQEANKLSTTTNVNTRLLLEHIFLTMYQ